MREPIYLAPACTKIRGPPQHKKQQRRETLSIKDSSRQDSRPATLFKLKQDITDRMRPLGCGHRMTPQDKSAQTTSFKSEQSRRLAGRRRLVALALVVALVVVAAETPKVLYAQETAKCQLAVANSHEVPAVGGEPLAAGLHLMQTVDGDNNKPIRRPICSHQAQNGTSSAAAAHATNWKTAEDEHSSLAPLQANEKRVVIGPYGDHWRFDYVDEHKPGFEVLLRERSVDERLANVMHTVYSFKAANMDVDIFNSGDPKLDRQREQLAAGAKVNDERCGQQLSQMLALIDELNLVLEKKRQNATAGMTLEERHFRLVHVLDSFGRYESGALGGRSRFPGSPIQCSGTKIILGSQAEPTTATTRYCRARLSLDRHLDARLGARKKASNEEDLMLHVGVCVPETCHTKSFRRHRELFQRLVDSQFKLPKSMFLDENLRVDSLFCDPDDDSPLNKIPFSGKLLLALLIGWFSLALYATFKPAAAATTTTSTSGSTKRINLTGRVLDALNLDKSWSDFMLNNDTNPTTRSVVQLDTLNPVKVYGCAYVVFGHSLLVHMIVNSNPLKSFRDLDYDASVFLMAAGTVITDTFFVITGLILTYIAMNRLHSREQRRKRQLLLQTARESSDNNSNNSEREAAGGGQVVGQFLKQCLQFGAVRYLRLMPLYLFVFWFKKSVLMHLFTGPNWDRGYNRDTIIGACAQESYFSLFTLGAAYLPLTQQCLPQAWSVADDIAVCIMVAPIVLLLYKRPKLATSLAVAASLASATAMYMSVDNMDSSLRPLIEDVRFLGISIALRDISYVYTIPFYRLFSLVSGVLAGYALHRYMQAAAATTGNQRAPQWPDWVKGPGTKASFVVLLIMLTLLPAVPVLKPNLLAVYPIHRMLFAHAMVTGRVLWSIANAILFLRMTTDWKDGYWMRKFSSKFWKVMARLNLAILLTHIDVTFYDQSDQAGFFNKYRFVASFGSSYMFCLFIGILLHVVIENPIDKLVKSWLMAELQGSGSDCSRATVVAHKKDDVEVEQGGEAARQCGSTQKMVTEEKNGVGGGGAVTSRRAVQPNGSSGGLQ